MSIWNNLKKFLGIDYSIENEKVIKIKFVPKKDITAWELLHMPLNLMHYRKDLKNIHYAQEKYFDNVPDEVKRHFEIIETEKETKT